MQIRMSDIRRSRVALGLTQAELGKLVRVSQMQISRLERHQTLGGDSLVRVLEVLRRLEGRRQ